MIPFLSTKAKDASSVTAVACELETNLLILFCNRAQIINEGGPVC